MKFEGSGSTTTRGSFVTGEWVAKTENISISSCSTNGLQRMLLKRHAVFCCPKDSRRGWVLWNEFDSSAYHANHGPWGCERWASTSGAGLLKCLKWIKWQIYDRFIFWYSFSGPVRCWKMLAVSDALCLIVPLQSLATCLCFIVQVSHLSWKHQDWTIADQQSL